MQLFMVKIGARPAGRLIEQHDVMFVVGESLLDVKVAVNERWQAVKNKWHIDAWREVNRVGDFQISIMENNADTQIQTSPQLYFINLGGYLPNEFEEFHHKMLVVADSLTHAKQQAKQSAFYQKFNIQKTDKLMPAVSHVDDSVKVDIDEIFAVSSLLEPRYQLQITPLIAPSIAEDSWHIGYLSIKNLPKINEIYYGKPN